MKHGPVGLLGGTFDPIHYGHIHIAREVLTQLPIERIKMIPCNIPVHRSIPHASAVDRVKMIELAIHSLAHVELDLREIHRQGPSYMIDTLRSLRKEDEKTPYCLILGADAYQYIATWKNWQELLDYCHFIVINRPLFPDKKSPNEWLQARETSNIKKLQEQAGSIFFLDMVPCDISATAIRERIRTDKSIDSLLPIEVADYIKQHQLYKST